MDIRPGATGDRAWAWIAWVTLAAALTAWAGRAVMPWDAMFPDALCYWTAGRLVAEGRSPYDAEAQARIQQANGWDREKQGRGILDYLPYYYPPWFALACTPMAAMDLAGAKLAWFAVNAWLLFASGALLRGAVPGVAATVAAASVPLFFLSLLALLLGQTTLVILFLVVASWRLLDAGWDRAGGAVMAGLATKPQLAAAVVLGVLVWAVRRRRWGVVVGFVASLAALSLIGALVEPLWPIRMLEAMRRDPPPTEAFPWIGASWLLVLRSLGLRSWALGAAYLAAAVPMLWAALAAAIDRARPLRETVALGLLAAFFVAPYGRHYDYPVLLVPMLVLLGDRLSERAGAGLLVAILLVPYVQFGLLVKYHRRYTETNFFLESTFFWIPAVLALAFLMTARGWRGAGNATGAAEA